MNTLRVITNIAIFSALVFVATMIIRIPIPATQGYFNVGDSMIYAAALLFGPLVGGFAGGIGAGLADIIGYPIFAPGTFIIKLVEGAIVGYIGYKIRPQVRVVTFWKAAALFLGIVLGVTTYYVGANYMGVFGDAFLDQILWAVIALFLAIFIVAMSVISAAKISLQTVAVVLGGAEMVLGYFLYENLLNVILPGLGIVAILEIPVNIGQMLVGMAIALPTAKAVQKAMPSERA